MWIIVSCVTLPWAGKLEFEHPPGIVVGNKNSWTSRHEAEEALESYAHTFNLDPDDYEAVGVC